MGPFGARIQKMTMINETLTAAMEDAPQSISWVVVGVFSAWGGLVRYLMDNRGSGHRLHWMAALSQIIISGFTGFLGGLYGLEHGKSSLMTLIIAGICSTLGSTLLHWAWRRILPEPGGKP